eukprot:s7504_g2.t1
MTGDEETALGDTQADETADAEQRIPEAQESGQSLICKWATLIPATDFVGLVRNHFRESGPLHPVIGAFP